MILVKAIQKNKKDYTVTFNDKEVVVMLDVMIKYHLRAGLELDPKTFKQLMDDNQYVIYLNLALEKLKKMQTAYELKTYLKDKGAEEKYANQVLEYLKSKKYIDDYTYVKTYISFKQTKEGPRMIEDKLVKKGINLSIIQGFTSKINEYQILNPLIEKKINSYSNKTKHQALQSTQIYYMQKGFTKHVVDEIVKAKAHLYEKDDKALLNKTYDKLLKKYKDKEAGYALKSLLKQKLYQKGFKLSDIDNLLDKN